MDHTDSGIVTHPHWRRNVAVFLAGQTVSQFGSMLVQYAIMWHLTLTTESGLVLALAAAFGFLPQALVSIFGGVWADRLNRRRLIIVADATVAASTAGLACVLLAGYEGLGLIYLTLAIRSVGAGIQMPAVAALIPQITPADQLMRVNGINGTIQSATMLGAPALAALVYANFSIVGIFFIDVGTAIIGIMLLLLVPVPNIPRPSGDSAPYLVDLLEGVRYIASHAFIRWLLMLFAVASMLAAAPSALTPLLIARNFGDEVWMLAAVELAFGIGMLLAGVAISIWAGPKNRVAMVVVASLAFGGTIIAIGLSADIWRLSALMFVLGFIVPVFSTPAMTLVQQQADPAKQGRVFGFLGIVMAVSMPFGIAVFGPLSDIFSVGTMLIIAGITMLAVVFIAAIVPEGRRALVNGASLSTSAQAVSRR